jgi:hypothetical protein
MERELALLEQLVQEMVIWLVELLVWLLVPEPKLNP